MRSQCQGMTSLGRHCLQARGPCRRRGGASSGVKREQAAVAWNRHRCADALDGGRDDLRPGAPATRTGLGTGGVGLLFDPERHDQSERFGDVRRQQLRWPLQHRHGRRPAQSAGCQWPRFHCQRQHPAQLSEWPRHPDGHLYAWGEFCDLRYVLPARRGRKRPHLQHHHQPLAHGQHCGQPGQQQRGQRRCLRLHGDVEPDQHIGDHGEPGPERYRHQRHRLLRCGEQRRGAAQCLLRQLQRHPDRRWRGGTGRDGDLQRRQRHRLFARQPGQRDGHHRQ